MVRRYVYRQIWRRICVQCNKNCLTSCFIVFRFSIL